MILAITNSGAFARRLGFAVPTIGIKTTGVVRCDQQRVIDLAARPARKVDTLPEPTMDKVLAKIATPLSGQSMGMNEFADRQRRCNSSLPRVSTTHTCHLTGRW